MNKVKDDPYKRANNQVIEEEEVEYYEDAYDYRENMSKEEEDPHWRLYIARLKGLHSQQNVRLKQKFVIGYLGLSNEEREKLKDYFITWTQVFSDLDTSKFQKIPNSRKGLWEIVGEMQKNGLDPL